MMMMKKGCHTMPTACAMLIGAAIASATALTLYMLRGPLCAMKKAASKCLCTCGTAAGDMVEEMKNAAECG